MLFSSLAGMAQTYEGPQKPRLIIGIVVEQMRYDYLVRYWDKFGENGFKKLAEQGANCRNTYLNYAYTESAPGFATIYTGATPSEHGIIGNFWYERMKKEKVYCVADPQAQTMGSTNQVGQMSPFRLLTTTLGDQMKLFSNERSKVFSLAMKDLAAVIPGGHTANGAFWYDQVGGGWVSSSYYYPDSLPKWVTDFNLKDLQNVYLNRKWQRLLPVDQYTESLPDSSIFELGIRWNYTTFPYDLSLLRGTIKPYEILTMTPFGNTLTTDFAIAALINEKLGQDGYTDMLCVAYSPMEGIGNLYGPQSVEIQDAYLRLDKEIAHLIEVAEDRCGRDNVLIFLTSDHGVSDVPLHLKSLRIPSGYISDMKVLALGKSYLRAIYGAEEWIVSYNDKQIYFDRFLLEDNDIPLQEAQTKLGEFIINYTGISNVILSTSLENGMHLGGLSSLMENSYNSKRSGDVMFVLEPGWMVKDNNRAVSHKSPYNYVLHVPLLWYGWKIKPRNIWDKNSTADIIPTICHMLGLPEPGASNGRTIGALIE
jgi:predicted AlkP superfamily pyrophosphatase or phosphodiesterase